MRVRAVRVDELPVLQDIERAAGACFLGIGMPEVAQDEPLPIGELARYREAGLAWVVADDAGLTPGLRAIREHEAARGMDRWPRVCMRRVL